MLSCGGKRSMEENGVNEMPLHFTEGRWTRIRGIYEKFWNMQSDRLVYGMAIREHPPESEPELPLLSQATCHDRTIPAEKVADRILLEMSQYEYYGDAFPVFNMDCFGPGIVAAFLGASLDNSTGRVWFHPRKKVPIGELDLRYDPDNVWFRRIMDICAALYDRMEGRGLIGLPDMGGALDILSTFYPGEELLFALYDEPEAVKAQCRRIEELWMQYYTELLPLCSLPGGGNTNWAGLFSETPSYILQCDFSYMIGPDMFREFALPTLERDCGRLDHVFYHLDGVGELPHLDMLLGLERLAGVQWIPGAGNPAPNDPAYIALYRKIRAAGKQVQIQYCEPECLLDIVGQMGGGAGLHHAAFFVGDPRGKDSALELLRRTGVEP